MSKERQRRREERERLAELVAAERAAVARRVARRSVARQALARWSPTAHSRQTGPLAERRRREAGVTFALLVAVNLLVFAFARDWSLTALTVVASLLGAPIIHLMLFKRTSR